jgi:hypothetical protein
MSKMLGRKVSKYFCARYLMIKTKLCLSVLIHSVIDLLYSSYDHLDLLDNSIWYGTYKQSYPFSPSS